MKYPPGGKITKTNYGPRIMLPFEEGTNLSEKYLDIAVDGPSAYAGYLVSSEEVFLGGKVFIKEIYDGIAAGNIYDTESYIVNYEDKEYNLSFTLHSGNIRNYDPSIRPKEFNREEEKKPYEQILSTFRFVEAENPSSAGYTLASSDGFSLQVYEAGKLYAEITRAQIENEFKQRYPNSSLGVEYPGFRYVGSSPSFFWDQKRGRLIFPISFEQVSGSSRTWDFFVFDFSSKKFFITPQGGSSPHVGIVPAVFKTSPDKDKFVYIAGGAGGTCTLHQYPAVIDLVDFSSLKLDESGIQIAREKNPQIPENDSYQDVQEIEWISNDQIRATIFFGCDDPEEENVEFQIIESPRI